VVVFGGGGQLVIPARVNLGGGPCCAGSWWLPPSLRRSRSHLNAEGVAARRAGAGLAGAAGFVSTPFINSWLEKLMRFSKQSCVNSSPPSLHCPAQMVWFLAKYLTVLSCFRRLRACFRHSPELRGDLGLIQPQGRELASAGTRLTG